MCFVQFSFPSRGHWWFRSPPGVVLEQHLQLSMGSISNQRFAAESDQSRSFDHSFGYRNFLKTLSKYRERKNFLRVWFLQYPFLRCWSSLHTMHLRIPQAQESSGVHVVVGSLGDSWLVTCGQVIAVTVIFNQFTIIVYNIYYFDTSFANWGLHSHQSANLDVESQWVSWNFHRPRTKGDSTGIEENQTIASRRHGGSTRYWCFKKYSAGWEIYHCFKYAACTRSKCALWL